MCYSSCFKIPCHLALTDCPCMIRVINIGATTTATSNCQNKNHWKMLYWMIGANDQSVHILQVAFFAAVWILMTSDVRYVYYNAPKRGLVFRLSAFFMDMMMSNRSAGARLKGKVYCCLGDAPHAWCRRQRVPSVCWHITAKLHGITIHKAMICMLTEQTDALVVLKASVGRCPLQIWARALTILRCFMVFPCSSWQMLGCNFIRQWVLRYQLFQTAGHEYSHCDGMCMIWETDNAESCYFPNCFLCFILSYLSSCLLSSNISFFIPSFLQ